MDHYTTLFASAAGQYEEKRSRFLAVAAPVQTPEQVAELVQKIKAQHYDARHHCYAYRLADGQKRYADDGEPQGTAGLPILDVLERRGISDCVIIVTRYFGGTLLGTGGLVRAYTAAANDAMGNADFLEMRSFVRCRLNCSYTRYGRLPAMVQEAEGVMEQEEFGEEVSIRFLLPENNVGSFFAALTEFSAGQLTMETEPPLLAGRHNGQIVYRDTL